nr:general stress protein [uncultured Azospirillum sp.]
MIESRDQNPTTIDSSAWTGDSGTTGADAAVREAVAVFDSREALQSAIDDLTLAGFQRHELSVLANDETIRERLGGVPGDVGSLAHDPDAPRQAYISPEDVGSGKGAAVGFPAYVGAIIATGAVLATGGTALAAAAAAAAAGVGSGAAGSFLSQWITDKRNEPMLQQLDKGGILLWVNVGDAARERIALEVLNRHAAHPAEVHEVRQTGSE